ncbi:retron St85 family RNA-directed DNA polymerase [Aeromonas caviae]
MVAIVSPPNLVPRLGGETIASSSKELSPRAKSWAFLWTVLMGVIEQLASALGKKDEDVIDFLVTAPRKYKVYTIPKRSIGHRLIAQPSQELKIYQKKYIELNPLPVHETAMAYRQGLSIKENAKAHQKSSYLLKMDLENFFNSITTDVFWQEWRAFYPQLSDVDSIILERLLFWAPNKKLDGKLILSIGAPSSPALSNFIMHRFDEAVVNNCVAIGVKYTRYADDLTFSSDTKDILFTLPGLIENILMMIFNGAIRVNKRKTIFSSKAHNRHVTGVTISNDDNISLGRERKRYIKHLVYQYMNGKLEKDQVNHLQGLLSFAKHIEPNFITSLNIKYTHKIIHSIMSDKQ